MAGWLDSYIVESVQTLNVLLREISFIESFTYSIGDVPYCTEQGQF
jgi:hypothetical protein